MFTNERVLVYFASDKWRLYSNRQL